MSQKAVPERNRLLNTEFRARRVLGGLLRGFQHLRARFSFCRHCSTVLAGEKVSHFCLPMVLRFARFRIMDISLSMIGLQVRRETAQIAKGWPFSVPASRISPERECASCEAGAMRGVALLRLPTTINQTCVFPHPLATADNVETRDLGLKARGVLRHPRTTPPRSRVCGVSLFAYDQQFLKPGIFQRTSHLREPRRLCYNIHSISEGKEES